jgi:RHS repeat-associated protein
MVYDYTGIRVRKIGNAGITYFPFTGYEVNAGVVTKYIRAATEIIASKQGTNDKRFYHNDHLGSVNVITNADGVQVQVNEYDPWGKVSRSVGNVDPNHRFTGQELDSEGNIHYYGGRYYNQDLGRFVSPDPFVQEPDNPQNLNRYSYVIDNPQNYIDPSGYGSVSIDAGCIFFGWCSGGLPVSFSSGSGGNSGKDFNDYLDNGVYYPSLTDYITSPLPPSIPLGGIFSPYSGPARDPWLDPWGQGTTYYFGNSGGASSGRSNNPKDSAVPATTNEASLGLNNGLKLITSILKGMGETPGTKYNIGGTLTDSVAAHAKMTVGVLGMAFGVAYGAAALVGADLIPPTALVTIPGVIGVIYSGYGLFRSGVDDLNKINTILERRNHPRVPEFRELPSKVPQIKALP